MTRTYKIVAASMGVLFLMAATWMVMPRQSHEIVIRPAVSVQR